MEELSIENLPELEKELNDENDSFSNVKPVKYLSIKQLTEFIKHISTAVGIIDDNVNRERCAKLTEQLRVLWLLVKNSIARGKKMHVPLCPSLQES
jgi:predicted house-cleaning noncanonical NTP pyrophosphatase (MazG superfamily)